MALINDIAAKIDEKVGFKHSQLKNNDIFNNGAIQKDDTWETSDTDASLNIRHYDVINQSEITVSKAFAEIGVQEVTGQSTATSQLTLTTDNVSLTSTRGADTYTTVIINPDGATINGDKIATEKTVNAKVARIPEGVELSEPEGAMQGNLTEEQLEKLQFNKANYILFAGKKYDLRNERSQQDSLSYVYNDYLNSRCIQDVITITVSTRSWVRNSCTLVTNKDYGDGVAGAVSIKKDFSGGLQLATTDGDLSIYGIFTTCA